ncbi:Cation-independent mannose-6-phosphate receptor, partial [Pseudolycoriella hygida]
NSELTKKNPKESEKQIVGKDCTVTEPLYNNTFDLTPLRQALHHQLYLSGSDYVNFNICGDVIPPCNGKTHVAACYTHNGTDHVMGLISDPLLTDGRIHLNYTGDVCDTNPQRRYNLQIIFICDYSDPITEPITSNEYSEKECSIHIFIRTQQACLPLPKEIQSNNCTVADKKTDFTFNLMALSQYNHRIQNSDNTTFVINVCKPVLYGHKDMCPPGSSICLENNNESNLSKKFVNYGSTVADPTYENGKLFMHFTSNEKCNVTHNISSHINFNCDTSIETGEPEYLGKLDCEHRFVWHTQLACNSMEPCVATDSRTRFRYDLTPLVNIPHTVKHENKTYTFGICNIANSPCKGKEGICEKTENGNAISMGLFNDHLKLNQTGSPYLLYVGGDVCEKPSRQWTTKIEFLCGKNHEDPIVVENTDCRTVIQYKTDLVCQNEISCKAYNYTSNTEIDLLPLYSSSHNYLAEVNDTLKATEGPPVLHYINVCRPLVPQYGLSCPGGTSACRAINGTRTPVSESSLGYPEVSLTVVEDSVQLKYFKGSVCPKDPQTLLSSVINFFCAPSAGRGKPILQEVLQDCHYVFDWATNIMCPTHLLKFDAENCDIFNDQLNATLNLKQITDKGIVSVKQESKSFDLNICANNRKVETDYAQGTVKIFFDGGSCKPNDPYSVELRMVCKELEKHSAPALTDSCGLVLIRETPLICPLLGITINPTDDSTKPDTTDTDANGEHAGTWGVVFLTFVILLVFGGIIYMAANSNRRAKVMSLFRRRSVSVQYSRVLSDEEASLLLPQPGSLSDSDDDLLT